jgi:hypothetical protein
MSIQLANCKRCKRLFDSVDLNEGDLCNACYSGFITQNIADLAQELMELPPEVDLYAYARRIATITAPYRKEIDALRGELAKERIKSSDALTEAYNASARYGDALRQIDEIRKETIMTDGTRISDAVKAVMRERDELAKQMNWLDHRLGELPSGVSQQIFGSSDWTSIEDAFKNVMED